MRLLAAILLTGCALTARPADLIHPGPAYCRPLNQDVWACTDANDWPWRCENRGGRWSCEAYHAPAPSAYIPPLVIFH